MEFARGDSDIRAMWSALHSCLHDLCTEGPLKGDFLQLFRSLEDWEQAIGDGRTVAEEEARVIASRLSRNS
jgi:hypothetical protein